MSTWLVEKCKPFANFVDDIKAKGLYSYFTELEQTGTYIKVGGNTLVNFSSNDYLGLTHDPRVITEAKKALDIYGSGLCGSRYVVGTTVEHVKLEEKIAAWKGKESCIVFTTGYQTLLGSISALLVKADDSIEDNIVLAIDKLSHACILDGCALSVGTHMTRGSSKMLDGQIRYFRHNDPGSLDSIVKSSTNKGKNVIIIVEGVYSMDGDICHLPEFVKIAEKYDACIAIDDAHGTGVLGKTGRGTAEHFGLEEHIDLLMGTFSKALGCVGGFVTGQKDVISHIKHKARSFMFSAAPPVSNIVSVSKIIDIIQTEPEHLQNLRQNEKYFKDHLKRLGFNYGQSATPIVPIIIGDSEKTMYLSKKLFADGVLMLPMVYPAVAKGEERLRCTISAKHSKADLDKALEVLETEGRKIGVI
ncbi:pyridoxal phosphate-dependent aminotransferase family protein [bacterium]|nr:MAG: pyridoxal phosphate-dependent aminotransferase family protein [bacterium]